MRDKHFITWLVGLLIVPFVLHSYSSVLNGLATLLPTFFGVLGILIVSSIAFNMLESHAGHHKEHDRKA